MGLYSKFYILFLVFILCTKCFSQSNSPQGLNYLNKLIVFDSLIKAKQVFNKSINTFKTNKEYDSLVGYITMFGNKKLYPKQNGIVKAKTLVEYIKKSNDDYIIKNSLLELAWLYSDSGENKQAYSITEQAHSIARNIKDDKKADLEGIQYSLGIRARDYGDMDLSKKHLLTALKIRNNAKDVDYESSYSIYNAMGGVMWYGGKLDSALHYFNKSLKALKKMDSIPLNQYYRPAIVQNNMSILAHATGNIDEAIRLCSSSVSNYQNFITTTEDLSRKARAKKFSLSTIDNLGAFYNSIGEYNRADELLTYSYQEKLKILEANDSNILISLVILGQSKISIKDFEMAATFLDKAIEMIENNSDIQLYWSSTAYITRASVFKEKNDFENATLFYEKGENLFRKALGKEYSKAFLDEIIRMSSFYAESKQYNKALALSNEALQFVQKSDYKNTLQEFHHLLNLSEVHYSMGNYKSAHDYIQESLRLSIGNNEKTSLNDSVQIQLNKPKALLLKVKTEYRISKDRTEGLLKNLLTELDSAIQIIEQRKSIIKSSDDLSLLLSENNDLFNFSKKLNLELFDDTGNLLFLNKAISLHESSLYGRIRSRIGLRNDILFQEIPEQIRLREKNLKRNLSNSLEGSSGVGSFIERTNEWNSFKDSLKQTHPKYYKMRYATIGKSLEHIQNKIPKGTSVVRYFFIEEQLYAYLVANGKEKLFPLDYSEVETNIAALGENQSNVEKTGNILSELYTKLWKPFEAEIETKNIIIVPDGPLYNLSFETLTPTTIKSFKELANNSLLAKYNIAYNYSLYLLNSKTSSQVYDNSFVAFAPEFNDKMKENYRMTISDSISADRAYLKLLQQPFNVSLAKAYGELFDGSFFLNESSTEQVFKKNANEHKIIHIGTHAESNNISPELSRLIFAKDVSNASDEDGSLYTYEIYNTSLNSNLAILTACETGKPSYQAGEGMISLAHAFNYAGSESILTSLWKIDERSSAEILAFFYDYIKAGKSKDEALRLAKLDYIKNTEGRTVAPQYWAGLVLMGDTAPINISDSTNLIYWILGIVVLVLLVILLKNKLRTP